jgi:glutamate N-acetyltransferase/amino-acid N-acetyltransferase
MEMKMIDNGVCAAAGFSANGIHCGIRKNKSKKDLALIFSAAPCNAAAVYTTNLVKGAPLQVTKKNLSSGKARAIICNSGNANTCNANGLQVAQAMCELTAQSLGIKAEEVVVASTGVIGVPLPIEPIQNGIPALVEGLGNKSAYACEAIMTTDTVPKEIAVEFEIGDRICHMGGIAKGSGMIHPNLATMLVFITTDVAISSALLQEALSEDVKSTFNMVSVDGDTSTNDMVVVLANGMAGNKMIAAKGAEYKIFCKALRKITVSLCRAIASDGEGASKLITCSVVNAADAESARKVAKSVVTSNLLKAAMFGADANWGRVLCAIGYSGANVDVNTVDVAFASSAGRIDVCADGAGLPFSEETAKKILMEKELEILINLNNGTYGADAWGCDLTYEYVRINGDYRT